MISKELLSEVVLKEISEDVADKPKVVFKTELEYYEKSSVSRFRHRINIYELACKCKEWVIVKEYKLLSAVTMNKEGMCTILCKLRKNRKTFIADTEPEAIFKACEWILKESK